MEPQRGACSPQPRGYGGFIPQLNVCTYYKMATPNPFSGVRGNFGKPADLTMNINKPTQSERYIYDRLDEIQHGGDNSLLMNAMVNDMKVMMPGLNYVGVRKNKVYPEAKAGFMDKNYSSSRSAPQEDILLPPPTFTIGSDGRPLTRTLFNNAL